MTDGWVLVAVLSAFASGIGVGYLIRDWIE